MVKKTTGVARPGQYREGSSYYFRKRSGDWRDRLSGKTVKATNVAGLPSLKKSGKIKEPTYKNYYGNDSLAEKKFQSSQKKKRVVIVSRKA